MDHVLGWQVDDPELDDRTAPELLRCLLVQYRMSESQLAERTGMAKSLISKIMCGDRRVTPQTAILLGTVFGLEPEEFIVRQLRSDLSEERERLSSRLSMIHSVRAAA